MTKDDIFITASLQSMESQITISDIPDMENQNFKVELSDTPHGIYVLKKAGGLSILEIIDTPENYGVEKEEAARVRSWYMNLKKSEEASERLKDCFADKAFTGLLLCGLSVTVLQKEAFGMPAFIDQCSFSAPVLQVLDIRFSGNTADVTNARLNGWMVGDMGQNVYKDAAHTFRFEAERTEAMVCGAQILYASVLCRFIPYRLFSADTNVRQELSLYGVYQQMEGQNSGSRGYSFLDAGGTDIALENCYISSITIAHIVAAMHGGREGLHVTMRCSGKMKFSLLQQGYDLFGYGDSKDGDKEGGLVYQNLIMELTLSGQNASMDVDYRSLSFTKQGSAVRESSFTGQFAHGCPGFLSWQGGLTPEQLNYTRIITPFPQKRLGDTWYGMTMEITIFGTMQLEFLFAFDREKLYIGSRMGKNGGSRFPALANRSPFRLQMKSMLLTVKEEGDQAEYGLLFKGLQASFLGLSLPEGNCNLYLTEDNTGASGWYAVYGSRRKAESYGRI